MEQWLNMGDESFAVLIIRRIIPSNSPPHLPL
jgi:hypothetical protein